MQPSVTLTANSRYSWESNSSNWEGAWAYDSKPSTSSSPWSNFSSEITGTSTSNTTGQLVARAWRVDDGSNAQMGSNPWQLELYSYDAEGRVVDKWIWTGDRREWDTHLAYEYNRQGDITKRMVEVGSQNLYHFYEYNQRGLLSEVVINTSDSKPSGEYEITYGYASTGAVDFMQYRNDLVGPSYKGNTHQYLSYDIRDFVTEISLLLDQERDTQIDLGYDYYDDGNIKNASYLNYRDGPLGSPEYDYMYTYSYDNLSRLESADYQTPDSNPPSYDVDSLRYDPAGNLTRLRRQSEHASLDSVANDFVYTLYEANRLTKLVDQSQVDTTVNETSSLKIVEVYYDSNFDQYRSAGEFVKVMNVSEKPVDLEGWRLEDIGDDDGQYFEVDSTYILPPDGIRIFANDKDTLYQENGLYPTPDFDLYSQNSHLLRLSNGGTATDEVIALKDPEGILVDYVAWGWNTYNGQTWDMTQNGYPGKVLVRDSIDLAATATATPEEWNRKDRPVGDLDRVPSKYGQQSMDVLTTYFSYDPNGNLISQSGKIDSITYEHRNLPTMFDMSNGSKLRASYNADGQRILKESSGGAWKFYVMDGQQTLAVIDNNGFSHFNLVGNSTFGRWEPGGTRRYYITDHLGSTRAVVDEAGNVLETFDYYPFGLLMPKRNTAGANTIEKFTGKERDTEAHLNLDYFGARYYDAALGRWQGVDPLLSKGKTSKLINEGYLSKSPYNYVSNNPVLIIDPDGMQECPPCGSGGLFSGFKSALSQGEDYLSNLFQADQQGQLEQKITVDALDVGIKATNKIGKGADIVETAALAAAPFTEGATLPVALTASTVATGAYGAEAGLEYAKANFMGSSRETAVQKGAVAAVGAVVPYLVGAGGRQAVSYFEEATQASRSIPFPKKNKMIINSGSKVSTKTGIYIFDNRANQ